MLGVSGSAINDFITFAIISTSFYNVNVKLANYKLRKCENTFNQFH